MSPVNKRASPVNQMAADVATEQIKAFDRTLGSPFALLRFQ
jgi:hypothetical protein